MWKLIIVIVNLNGGVAITPVWDYSTEAECKKATSYWTSSFNPTRTYACIPNSQIVKE